MTQAVHAGLGGPRRGRASHATFRGLAWVCFTWQALVPLAATPAQDATEKFLTGLKQVQAEYCERLFYPATQTKPQPALRWNLNDAKQARIKKLSTRGVDPEIVALVEDARRLSDEISAANRDYLKAIDDAGKKYEDNPPLLDGSPDSLFDAIMPLLPGVQAESKLSQLRTRCKTDEADFAARWKARLNALASVQARLKSFALDPDTTSPLSGFGMPTIAWTPQELGTQVDNPYDLGELREPVKFDVTPLPAHSWLYYYRLQLPTPMASTPQGKPQFRMLNVQVSSTAGLVHANLVKSSHGKTGVSNERATSRPGQPAQLQMPLMTGEDYLLCVYHVAKPDFGPAWGATAATLRIWEGDETDVPTTFASRVITIESQQKMRAARQAALLEAHQKLQRITVATFARKPTFQGTYVEQGKHAFTLQVQDFTPASRGITGEIDWPSYGGATRFRGQLTRTPNGLEVNFTETDFVPGRSSPKLLLNGEYRLIPELQGDKLVLRGEVSYSERKHPLSMQTLAVDSSDTGGAVVPEVTTLPDVAPPSRGPQDPRGMAIARANGTRQSGAGNRTPSGKAVASNGPPATNPAAAPTKSIINKPTTSFQPAAEAPAAPAAAEFAGLTVKRPASGMAHKAGLIHAFQEVTSYDGPPSVLFSKDGKFAVATGDRLRAWDLIKGQQTLDLDQQSFQAVLLPNGSKTLFTGGVSSAGHALFQMQTRKGAAPPTHSEELERTTALAVSRDGKLAVVSQNPGVLVFFDLVKNRRTGQLNLGHDASALAFAEGASTLISADDAHGVRVWKLKDDGEILGRFNGHGDRATVRSLQVSDDGQQVLSVSSSSSDRSQAGPLTLIIWSRQDLKERHSVALGAQAVSVAVSPDWRYALVGELSGEVQLCSVATGEVLETCAGHTGPVTAVAFSPCWKFALSASNDATVRLWGLEGTP